MNHIEIKVMAFSKDWQPDEQNVNDIEEQIRSERVQGNLAKDDNFIKNCAKIGAFLMDESVVREQLIELNKKLSEELHKLNKYISDKGAVKVLRNLLEKELGEAGFQENLVQTIGTKGMQNKHFQSLLSQGFLFKDSSLRDKPHGELTHAIQWVLIVWQQKATQFLKDDKNGEANIIDLFKTLGNPEARSQRSIWSLIVDESEDERLGARSPECLSKYINGNTDALACLQEVLEKRFKQGKEKGIEHLDKKLETTDHYEKHDEIPNVLMPKNK